MEDRTFAWFLAFLLMAFVVMVGGILINQVMSL